MTQDWMLRITEHIQYTLIAMVLASLIAIPLGVWIGHQKRLMNFTVVITGALRALPTLGLLTVLALLLPQGATEPIIPTTLVLVLLAVPPLLAGTYSGFNSVAPETVDAAYAVGYSTRQVVFGVEFPLALPVIIGGMRSATLQVIATATIAAYVGLGGLGRFVLDALAVRDYPLMIKSALVVALLAIIADVCLAFLARLLKKRAER